ncbi:hypothetical protein BH09ACT8_BH09ACT8_02480 [soil metagenome]
MARSQLMTAPAPAQTLIDTGGLVITDDGRRVNVIDRTTGGWAIALFVLAVVAVVVGGFGMVVMAMGVPSRGLGAVFTGVGLIIAAGAVWILRTIKRRRAQPLGSCRSVALLDRKLGLFTMAGGALLPLNHVRFERRMQVGSSSPKLVAVTPAGSYVLKHGNPFDGSIGNSHEILNAVVAGQL